MARGEPLLFPDDTPSEGPSTRFLDSGGRLNPGIWSMGPANAPPEQQKMDCATVPTRHSGRVWEASVSTSQVLGEKESLSYPTRQS